MTEFGFHYREQVLHVDDVSVSHVADKYGTPVYVYSGAEIKAKYKALKDALTTHIPEKQLPLISYACKANSHLAILSYMASLGAGADVVSGGELQRARKAGIPGNKIVFSGVGKSTDEINLAINENILQINVESEPELYEIAKATETQKKSMHVAFRVNPDVDAKTHEKITTGKAENKFGIDLDRVFKLYEFAASHEFLEPVGLSVHIGSQLTDITPFQDAFKKLADMVKKLRSNGHKVQRLDLGGGLGVIYNDETPPDLDVYARIIKDIICPLETELVLEPGRFLIADAGALVTNITYIKDTRSEDGKGKQYLILDAGMNNLLRPALYEAYHPVWPIKKTAQHTETYDIVGPICETGDTFHKGYELPTQTENDLLAFMMSGAYSSVMASFYNSKDFPAEVFIEGQNIYTIRNPITLQDIMEHEVIPDWDT